MSIQYIKGVQASVDKNEIIKLLRSALADELLAVHSYWVQSKVIQGVHKDEINKELMQHQDEETKHANMLMDRILQLGGNPEIRPIDWDKLTQCRYNPNISWDQRDILENALNGEKCATEHYSRIAEFVRTKDATTYDIVSSILDDEYEHIRDLSKLQELFQQKIENKQG